MIINHNLCITHLISEIHILTKFLKNKKSGGAKRDRTADPLLAKQVLSQLSYSPKTKCMVGLVGLEPTTPALSRRCSNQLSYRPGFTIRLQPIRVGNQNHYNSLERR